MNSSDAFVIESTESSLCLVRGEGEGLDLPPKGVSCDVFGSRLILLDAAAWASCLAWLALVWLRVFFLVGVSSSGCFEGVAVLAADRLLGGVAAKDL